MDRVQFWALIEAAKTATGSDCQAQTAQLVAALRQGPVEEVLDWDRIHTDLWVESYRRDLPVGRRLPDQRRLLRRRL